jgi:2-C-methyl-D-erythritol 4-phosphate cytidylyltransferase
MGVSKGKVVGVVLAAGHGARMQAPENKIFLPIGGMPVLARALRAFERTASIDEVILVGAPDELQRCRCHIVEAYGLRKVRQIVPGGPTRHDSEYQALQYLRREIESGLIEVVLIHDGARPFVEPDMLTKLVATARMKGSAVIGLPLAPSEVIVLADAAGRIDQQFSLGATWRVQTPQAFMAGPLLRAYDRAAAEGFRGTDTASALERAGESIYLVHGSARNIKITTPPDLLHAERLAVEAFDL